MPTGRPSVDTATESIALDVSAYITKPVSTSEVRETLLRVVAIKGMVRSPEEELHLAI